jgi:hypothetical protein
MSDKKIIQEDGENILPITHESCVLDDNGNPITDKIGDVTLLRTESRNLVAAVNEVFGNSIKEQIVNLLNIKYRNEIEGPVASMNTSWSDILSLIRHIDMVSDMPIKDYIVDILIRNGIEASYTESWIIIFEKLNQLNIIDTKVTNQLVSYKIEDYPYNDLLNDYSSIKYMNYKLVGEDCIYLGVCGTKKSTSTTDFTLYKYNLSSKNVERSLVTSNSSFANCYFLDDKVIVFHDLYTIHAYSLSDFSTIKQLYRSSDIRTDQKLSMFEHNGYLFIQFPGYTSNYPSVIKRINLNTVEIDKSYAFNSSLISYGYSLYSPCWIYLDKENECIYTAAEYNSSGYIAKLSLDLTLIENSPKVYPCHGPIYIKDNKIFVWYMSFYNNAAHVEARYFVLDGTYTTDYYSSVTGDKHGFAYDSSIDVNIFYNNDYIFIKQGGVLVSINKNDFNDSNELSLPSNGTLLSINDNGDEFTVISKRSLSVYKMIQI